MCGDSRGGAAPSELQRELQRDIEQIADIDSCIQQMEVNMEVMLAIELTWPLTWEVTGSRISFENADRWTRSHRCAPCRTEGAGRGGALRG